MIIYVKKGNYNLFRNVTYIDTFKNTTEFVLLDVIGNRYGIAIFKTSK